MKKTITLISIVAIIGLGIAVMVSRTNRDTPIFSDAETQQISNADVVLLCDILEKEISGSYLSSYKVTEVIRNRTGQNLSHLTGEILQSKYPEQFSPFKASNPNSCGKQAIVLAVKSGEDLAPLSVRYFHGLEKDAIGLSEYMELVEKHHTK